MDEEDLLESARVMDAAWEEVVDALPGLICMTVDAEFVYDGAVVLWCKTHDECYGAGEGIEPAHGEPTCGPKSQFFASARHETAL